MILHASHSIEITLHLTGSYLPHTYDRADEPGHDAHMEDVSITSLTTQVRRYNRHNRTFDTVTIDLFEDINFLEWEKRDNLDRFLDNLQLALMNDCEQALLDSAPHD